MPPSRRRPTPQPQPPQGRRPRVAGLRRPTAPEPVDPTQKTEDIKPARDAEPSPAVEPVEPVAEVEPIDEIVEPEIDDVDDVEEDDDEVAAVEDDDAEEEADEEPSAKAEPKTRPSGKRRSAGLRAPTAKADLAKAERRSRDGKDGRRPARAAVKLSDDERTARGRSTMALVLVVAALVLAGLAVWFRIEAVNAGDAADTGNSALTDTGATSQLIGELRPPIEAVFSLDYQHLDKTSQAASANLTEGALKQYNQLFGVVRDNAPKQKLVSTFKIREISVMSLRGDNAEVLVFADQTSNKPCDPRDDKVRTCGAAIGVPAQRVNGHWKIAGFDMFNGNPVG